MVLFSVFPGECYLARDTGVEESIALPLDLGTHTFVSENSNVVDVFGVVFDRCVRVFRTNSFPQSIRSGRGDYYQPGEAGASQGR